MNEFNNLINLFTKKENLYFSVKFTFISVTIESIMKHDRFRIFANDD